MTYRSNYGRCHKCKRIRVLVNKKYELCRECNKQRLGVKTKTKPLKSYRKSTGELTLFHRIWNKRYHISAISKEPLNKYFFEDPETHKSTLPFMCHHVLPKSKYPKFRLCAWNIILITPEEHYIIHNVARSNWTPEFRAVYEELEKNISNRSKLE